MRRYKDKDKKRLTEMLLSEGVEDMSFEEFPTWVTRYGFFTIGAEHGFPHLLHFCVEKKYRNIIRARQLVKQFKKVIKDNGLNKTIVHGKQEYLCKLIEYYFKVKPYGQENNMNYYLVEVK